MSVKHAELALKIDARLGEGPVWDTHTGFLWFVDITGKSIHSFHPESGEHRTINTSFMPSSIGFTNTEALLITSDEGLYLLNPGTGHFTHLCDPEASLLANRFNDGKCDPWGRYWAGTMSMDGSSHQSALYKFDDHLTPTKMLEKVSISNGIAWDTKRSIMYYIDTPTRAVDAFDFNITKGELYNRRQILHFDDDHGLPDGMTIDEEGMLWIAEWGGGRVCRWRPNTNQPVETVKLPASLVTSCSFGGPSLNRLYITTATEDLTPQERHTQALAGSLFYIDTHVSGRPEQTVTIQKEI